jgi:hypothetical protein
MAGFNAILENIHPDEDAVAKRQARGYPPLKPVIDTYAQYLHLEMWMAYLCGLDHAAVVTACALVESTMKSGLYLLRFVDDRCRFNRGAWDQIDGLEFAASANMAKRRGLVTKDEWKHLEWIREHIRNHYMHGATPKWLKDIPPDEFVVGSFETGEVRDAEGTLGDHLPAQRIARVAADRNVCKQVIPLADSLVRQMSERAVAKVEEYKAAHPSQHGIDDLARVLNEMQRKGIDVDRIEVRDQPVDPPPAGGRP